jgi:hypothetical protein
MSIKDQNYRLKNTIEPDIRTAYTFTMDYWDDRTKEEVMLDDMDIAVIEKYLRKKKIQNLPKEE